jgi:TPR repeat protein
MQINLLSSWLDSLNQNLQKGFLILRNARNVQARRTALQLFINEAEQDDKQAFWIVALCYHFGIGNLINDKKAKLFAKKALQYREGNLALGLIYFEQGKFDKAFPFLEKAANSDLIEAKYYLGHCYRFIVAYESRKKARELFEEVFTYGERKLTSKSYIILRFVDKSFDANKNIANEFKRTSRNQLRSLISYFIGGI